MHLYHCCKACLALRKSRFTRRMWRTGKTNIDQNRFFSLPPPTHISRFQLISWHEAQFIRNHRDSACCLLPALRMSGYWESRRHPARSSSPKPELPAAAAVWSHSGAPGRGVFHPIGKRGLELFPICVLVLRRVAVALRQSRAAPADAAPLAGESWEHPGAHRRLSGPRRRVHGEGKAVRGPADLPGPDLPPAAGDDGDVQGGAAGPAGAEQQKNDGAVWEMKTSFQPRQRSHFPLFCLYFFFFLFCIS